MRSWLHNGGYLAMATMTGILVIVAIPLLIRAGEQGKAPVAEDKLSVADITVLSQEEIITRSDELMKKCAKEEAPDDCVKKGVLDIIPGHGPQTAILMTDALIMKGAELGGGDHHDFVHKIGRTTAKAFGVNADAFFACPEDYNYGCPHGFFEQALVEAPDARQAALNVCDPERMKTRARKSYFYCYHGVGHGIMMAKAYDVQASLDVCNEFPDNDGKTGCWQGVFMENVNSVLTGKERAGAFTDDPLYPCNALEPQYQWQCYTNHAGYMVNKLSPGRGDVVSAACLKAAEPAKRACIEGLGLMATNPGWQLRLVPEETGDFYKNAVAVCESFPKEFREACVIAGIDNLANFDRTETKRMLTFCGLVKDTYKGACYREMSRAVMNELPPGDGGTGVCDGVPETYVPQCLSSITGFPAPPV